MPDLCGAREQTRACRIDKHSILTELHRNPRDYCDYHASALPVDTGEFRKEQQREGSFLNMGPEARRHGLAHSPLGTLAHLATPP